MGWGVFWLRCRLRGRGRGVGGWGSGMYMKWAVV